jgi:HK97 family phage portal protein
MAQNFIQASWEKFTGKAKNSFNQAFFQWIGNGYAKYDYNNKTYLDKGYNENPTVFSIINKQTVKTVSVPYAVKQIQDKEQYGKLQQFQLATKGDVSVLQMVKKAKLELKAYSDKELPFPLEQPNPTQTWADVWGLFKTYMKITGNYYFYMVMPEEGANKGVPIQVYVLPSHLMQIVLKKDANLLTTENPIDYYMLVEGNQWIKFMVDEVIHVKYVNPNYDMNGSHLYGQSPLRAGLRNINSQNSAMDNNIKMLQSSGAYGFLYGKTTPLSPEQAQSLKDRLVEMDKDTGRLGKIGASSAEIGFQRISLTTDELKPFDYLNWDQKTICNVLNFPDELLNADGKASLGNTDTASARKQLITDDIQPDLTLLQHALNKNFISRFRGYENAIIEWDITELPEMQEDMLKQAQALKEIYTTPNEVRTVFKYETLPDDGMDTVWIGSGMKRIDDISEGVINDANF